MLDLLLSIISWFIKTALVPILPVSIPFFTIETYSGLLNSSEGFITSSLSGLGSVLDINLVFILAGVVIYAEIILIVFKATVFLINLGRGSGA